METTTIIERSEDVISDNDRMRTDFLERLIFKGIYSDIPDYKEKVFNSFKGDYFDDPMASDIFKIMKSYFSRYLALPSDIEIRGKLSDYDADEYENYINQIWETQISSVEHLENETSTYLREKALKNAIMRSVDYVETNPEKVFEIIEAVKEIALYNQQKINFSTIGNLQSLGIEPKRYYLKDILFQAQLILLVGDAGMGKSIILMHLVNCLTQGRNFLDWENVTSEPIKCLYFDGEMSIYDVLERAEDFQLDPDVGYYPMRYFQSNNNNEIQGDFSDPKYRKYVEEQIIENDIKVFIFDNITSLTNGLDENSTKDWSQMNQWFLRLRGLGITTIIVHHTGKDGKSQRGTSSRIANIDNEWFISRPSGWDETDEDFRAVISFGNKIRSKRGKAYARREIKYSNGEWSTDHIICNESNGGDTDEIHYRALKMMIKEPDIRQIDVQSALNLSANSKLFSKLEEREYITRPSNKKFTITEKGHLWIDFMSKSNTCDIEKEIDDYFHENLSENGENDQCDIINYLYY